MKSIPIKPQIILYFYILSGLIVLILPWGFAGTDMTFRGEPLFPLPDPTSVRLGVWELNDLRTELFISQTELNITSEATRQKLDFLTAAAGVGLLAAPIIALALFATCWRYLSRGSRYHVVFLLIVSILVLFLYLLLAGPNLTGPNITRTVVNEVRYNCLILLLMLGNLFVGLGSSIYFILKKPALDNRSAS
jgi:hypothetical protein